MCPVFPENEADADEIIKDTRSEFDNLQGFQSDPSPACRESNAPITTVSLPDGRLAMMLDIGSVGNLVGSKWMKAMAIACTKHGRKPVPVQRDRPLNITGVGKTAQICEYNVHVPISIPCKGDYLKGVFKAPCVPDSDLPALFGLQSMKNSRTIIDTVAGKIYLMGTGDYDLMRSMPPGTREIQCCHANTGHMMLPVDSFAGLDETEKFGETELEVVVLSDQDDSKSTH